MTSKDKAHEPPIYPAHCHIESPTLGTWCPILACDIHKLIQVKGFEGQNIYFHQNHPIRWVKLTGVVVSIDQHATRLILILDDSSGVNIEAICTAPPRSEPKPLIKNTEPNAKPEISIKSETENEESYISPDGPKLNFKNIDVGSVVKIHGGLNIFREQMQIKLKQIRLLHDTNEEIKCWNESSSFKRDILSLPWEISQEMEGKCKRRAERGAIKAEKAKKEERRRQRAEELTRRHERELKHKIHQEKLAKQSDTVGYGQRSSGIQRGPSETARRFDKLGQTNRVNQLPRAPRESFKGDYDALGL